METSECELVPIYDYEEGNYKGSYEGYWCHTCEQYVDEPCGIGDGEV